MRFNVPVEVENPTITITLPPDIPLMCDGAEAARLFGISPGTLNNLRKRHKNFPARCIGSGVRYMVPELYAFFRDYPGGVIPVTEQ